MHNGIADQCGKVNKQRFSGRVWCSCSMEICIVFYSERDDNLLRREL